MPKSSPSRLLIKGGTILTMDPALGDLDTADVLIEQDRIRAVQPGLDAAGAEVIDATGMLVIPGLIDSHTHMWQAPLKGIGAGLWGMADYSKQVFPLREQFSAADMYDATFAAGVEMLDHGITTVLDFCHNVMTPEHADQSLRAHWITGQRILFAYGMLGRFTSLEADQPWRLDQVRSLQRQIASHESSLVRLGMAMSSLEHAGLKLVENEVLVGRGLGLLMRSHQHRPGQIRELHAAKRRGADMLPVHANLAAEDELDVLARFGGGISFTTEGEFGGGRSMSIIGRAHRAGVTPSLGVDIPSRVALDIFAQMRLTFSVMRSEEATVERLTGRWPLARHPGTPHVQPRHMLEYVTVNAARAVGLGTELGRIAPDCLADVVLLRTGPYGMSLGDPAAHVALQSTPADVDTVVLNGVVRKKAGRLVDLDPAEAAAATRRVRERVFGSTAR